MKRVFFLFLDLSFTKSIYYVILNYYGGCNWMFKKSTLSILKLSSVGDVAQLELSVFFLFIFNLSHIIWRNFNNQHFNHHNFINFNALPVFGKWSLIMDNTSHHRPSAPREGKFNSSARESNVLVTYPSYPFLIKRNDSGSGRISPPHTQKNLTE